MSDDYGVGLVCGLLIAFVLMASGCPHKYASEKHFKEGVARCISFGGLREVRGYALEDEPMVRYACNDGSVGRVRLPVNE